VLANAELYRNNVRMSRDVSTVMKAYMGVDVKTHILLTSVLAGSEWPSSCLSYFIPWCPFDKRLGGNQNQFEPHGEVKIFSHYSNPLVVQLLYQLCYPGPVY
jgi:hypothetical protein